MVSLRDTSLRSYFVLILLSFGLQANPETKALPYQWVVGSPRVKTVKWTDNGTPVSWPLTALNGMSRLSVSFDMLETDSDTDTPFLRARLEHRDAEWRNDNLSDSEFIDGFNISDIGYGEPSAGGITTLYRHFELPVPPPDLRPKIPGNYILHIYDDSDPDRDILSLPFMVEEQTVSVGGDIAVVTDIDYKARHQQLKIDVTSLNIDPRVRPTDFKVYVWQNSTPGTVRNLGFPTRIDNKTAFFEHKNELIFPAGNEYRRMEIIDDNVPMLHVDHIEWHDPFYHQILQTDYSRAGSPYLYQFNNHGMFVVREYNSSFPDYEADYCVVHFTLVGDNIDKGSEIYLDGDFTGHSLTDDYRMSYDESTNTYYKSLLLKQGAYDYKYITPCSTKGLYSVEGDFYETDNLYNVAVYYRVPGERFDRLAGTATLRLY